MPERTRWAQHLDSHGGRGAGGLIVPWHLIAETFLTHSEPIAPALALRNRMQEAFGVTHALAPPRQVPPGGAEGWRLQHGEHLLIRDAAENLVASIALDRPQHESHDEI